MRKISYAGAIAEALRISLAEDPRVSLVGSYVLGLGPKRVLMDPIRAEFPDRIYDPPISEAAIVSIGADWVHQHTLGAKSEHVASHQTDAGVLSQADAQSFSDGSGVTQLSHRSLRAQANTWLLTVAGSGIGLALAKSAAAAMRVRASLSRAISSSREA